jgi:hypothetical protein
MTDQQHPITPPLELVQQWEEDWHHSKVKHIELEPYIAAQAAQWGADAQLEKCHEWLNHRGYNRTFLEEFRAALRPKPPSLKEEALKGFDTIADIVLEEYSGTRFYEKYKKVADTVRRALEALPE